MAKNFFSLKPRNVMWWWPLFICVLFLRERYYRYLTEKQRNILGEGKATNFFSFESKLSIVFHPSIIGVFILPFTNCANNRFILSKEIVLESWPGTFISKLIYLDMKKKIVCRGFPKNCYVYSYFYN